MASSTRWAHAFARLAFEPDPLGLDLQDVGNPLANGLAIGQELGPLGEDNAIDVDDPKSNRRHGIAGGDQHLGRVAAAVGRIRIGKHLADVAQGGRPQKSVGYGVEQGVGIAMADHLPVMGDVDPP